MAAAKEDAGSLYSPPTAEHGWRTLIFFRIPGGVVPGEAQERARCTAQQNTVRTGYPATGRTYAPGTAVFTAVGMPSSIPRATVSHIVSAHLATYSWKCLWTTMR